MPKKAKPRFDRHNNQWVIYHQGRYRYLCSGNANEALAWKKAERIKGHSLDSADGPPVTVAGIIDLWIKQRGSEWHARILRPFGQYAIGHVLDSVHHEYLVDYLIRLQRVGYTREFKQWTGKGKTRRKVNRKRSGSYSPSMQAKAREIDEQLKKDSDEEC